MKHFKQIGRFIIAALLLFLAGCQSGAVEPPGQTPAEAPRVLNIYNWDTYIDPDILADFAAEFDVTINYDIFESSEEMIATIRANPSAYDLVVPTDYSVAVMRRERLLGVLNWDNIPNQGNIDSAFLNPPYDPGGRHCVPYQWGTMGVGYNEAAVGRTISSWEEFFSPEFYGRIALMDSSRTTLGLTLLYLGYSPNSGNPAEIAAARDFLISINEHIVAYAPDTGQDMLLDGTADLVIEWSGDISQIMGENANIRYLIPTEGSIIWTDSICLMAEAQNPELAEAFINYLLEPEVGAALSDYIRYASPNEAAQRLLPLSDLANPILYPTIATRQRLFSLVDVGGEFERLYADAWAAVIADFEAKR